MASNPEVPQQYMAQIAHLQQQLVEKDQKIKELNEIIGEQESELRKWKAYGADYKAQYEHFANAIKTAYDTHSSETIEMIKNARARSNNYDIRPVQPRLRLATGAVNTAIATGAGTAIATGAVNISRRSSSVPANSATNSACSSMHVTPEGTPTPYPDQHMDNAFWTWVKGKGGKGCTA